jgi:hypothetical protein
MRKPVLLLAITLMVSILGLTKGMAQDSLQRTVGISATVQTTQMGIMVPCWVTNKISFAPALDIRWGEKIGTDFTLGIVPRFYLSKEKLTPYLGLRGGVAIYIPDQENDGEKNTTDWIAGIAFGGEYFFDPRFSFGVELQANFTKSDENSMRFNNPGNWNFNLGTMVSANIYFTKPTTH